MPSWADWAQHTRTECFLPIGAGNLKCNFTGFSVSIQLTRSQKRTFTWSMVNVYRTGPTCLCRWIVISWYFSQSVFALLCSSALACCDYRVQISETSQQRNTGRSFYTVSFHAIVFLLLYNSSLQPFVWLTNQPLLATSTMDYWNSHQHALDCLKL